MSRYVYPAVITKEDGGYSVSFPDLPNGATCGGTLADAMFMAEDFLAMVLCEYEDEGLELPAPTDIAAIPTSPARSVSLIPCDTFAYREANDTKLVNKTVTIEAWMNRRAEKAHLNCSRLLRNAIISELNLK